MQKFQFRKALVSEVALQRSAERNLLLTIRRLVLLSAQVCCVDNNGLATLTPARPDRNGTGPVPAYFFSVLQSGFLAHSCSMPACLHQNFEGTFVWNEKRLKAEEKQVKIW